MRTTLPNCMSRRKVVKVKVIEASIQSNCPSKMKQLLSPFRQMCDVKGINAVSTDHHFIVSISSDSDDFDAHVHVMTVSLIYQIVVDEVLYINTNTTVRCR